MDTKKKDIFAGTVTVEEAGGLKGEITVPGDKSISHRSVILGSIADGITEIDGFLQGEDNFSTLKAFRSMGVACHQVGARLTITGNGIDGLKEPGDVIDAGNSGTTARLLLGLLSAQRFFTVLTGDSSLRKRPMKRVVAPLQKMGASITGRNGGALLPLAITGTRLKGITYSTPVASAQLKSAILLAGLYAEGETIVKEPEKSRDHTERMLRHFGADISVEGTSVRVTPARRLTGCRIRVPGDISSAAFFMVGAAITPGSDIVLRNVGTNPTRTGIIHILEKMGAAIEIISVSETSGETVSDIRVRSAHLKGCEISGAELLPAIDEFPIICVAAAFASGTTTISGAAELRIKESDRVAVMSEVLTNVGVKNTEKDDGIIIEGSGGKSIRGGQVNSYGDHRIAMSMAMAGLRSSDGVNISGAESVDVSFPGFFGHLSKVRV